MIETSNNLSISKQCELLNFPKSTYYYEPIKKDKQNSLLEIVEAVHLKYPFYGYRRLNLEIRSLGYKSSRNSNTLTSTNKQSNQSYVIQKKFS